MSEILRKVQEFRARGVAYPRSLEIEGVVDAIIRNWTDEPYQMELVRRYGVDTEDIWRMRELIRSDELDCTSAECCRLLTTICDGGDQ